MTTLAGPQQVQIKITVAEANRTAIRALGVNAFFGGSQVAGGITPGPDVGGALNQATFGLDGALTSSNINSANTLFALFPNSDIAVFVQALAENEYLRVLSEPTLVALSGEEASFLAGGEFPIPVVQGSASTTGGVSVSVDYKKFGVQLKFRPTVTGEGNIRLHVAPEVSELSNVGAVTLQGFNIPGVATRRAETTVELKSGQTFGLAGLINQSTQARSSRVPGLGDLPVIGALFRSVRYKQGDTELVLLVTASLVEPVSLAKKPPVPGQFHVVPNDWEVYALGRNEGKGQPTMSASDKQWLRDRGLDRLKGPGAWVSYDARSAVSAAPNKPTNVPPPAGQK
jgi:pilus assembly protein CpaC